MKAISFWSTKMGGGGLQIQIVMLANTACVAIFSCIVYLFLKMKKKQPIYSRQIGNDGVHRTHQIHSHPENIPKNWSNKDAREMYPSRWSRDSFQYNNIYFILKLIDFPQVQGKKKKAEHQTEVATYTFLHPRWHPLPCTPARRMWRLARRHQFPFWLQKRRGWNIEILL